MPSEQPESVSASRTAPVIDGVAAGRVESPVDGPAVASLLADAANLGQSVIPVGGGTALSLGNPPTGAGIVLSTAKLGGIIDYEPVDLVLSVGAGARLGDVQAVLAEHGQTLPIDPPGGDDATIGGLVATALTGPLRLSAGSLRDLLIGISLAHPSGTITKAGGMVVKNVSGFDLPRVYHGSMGTLGVILSANFKVLPLPRTETTVLARCASLEAAAEGAQAFRRGGAPATALEAGWFDDAWFIAARFAGREPSVRAGAASAANQLPGEQTQLDPAASALWWKRFQTALNLTTGPNELMIRATVRPRETATLALGVARALPIAGGTLTFLSASVGLGSVVTRLVLEGGSADRLAEVQTLLRGLADNVTILAAPPAWKSGLDVWGATPETLDLMRAMKDQFDPHRVLNPGRFAGHL